MMPAISKSAHPGPGDVLLIIEVADTSLRYDRDTKIPLYACHDIPEAWLVDIENRRLTVCRRPAPDGYRDVAAPVLPCEASIAALPGISVDLSGLF